MDSVNEAPASYRSSAARPSAVRLVTSAVTDVLSRRRLIRYLVMADIRKKGTDTLLGNLWWIMDPIIAMAILMGLLPNLFLKPLGPSVERMLNQVQQGSAPARIEARR